MTGKNSKKLAAGSRNATSSFFFPFSDSQKQRGHTARLQPWRSESLEGYLGSSIRSSRTWGPAAKIVDELL